MEPLLLWPIIGAMCIQIGAGLDTQRGLDTQAAHKQLRAYVLEVNPSFPYPDDAANLLVKIEGEGGPPAALFAALIKLESRWGVALDHHPWNLSQLTRHNQRKHHGRLIRGWVESVRWGAEYFKWNLAGATKPGRARKDVWFVALAKYNDGPRGPRTQKGRTYAQVVLRFYREGFEA